MPLPYKHDYAEAGHLAIQREYMNISNKIGSMYHHCWDAAGNQTQDRPHMGQSTLWSIIVLKTISLKLYKSGYCLF